MKKTLKISLSVLLVVFLLAVVLFGFQYWRIKTGRILKVNVGGEEMWITKETFQKSMPRLDNVVAPDQNTPEEVYTKFREAILNNNIEGALQSVIMEKRADYNEKLKNDIETYKKLPDSAALKDRGNHSDGVTLEYGYIINNANFSVLFEKTPQGYWYISGI